MVWSVVGSPGRPSGLLGCADNARGWFAVAGGSAAPSGPRPRHRRPRAGPRRSGPGWSWRVGSACRQ
eukprot:4837242-Lingulodinium_polyedra.AAC.1